MQALLQYRSIGNEIRKSRSRELSNLTASDCCAQKSEPVLTQNVSTENQNDEKFESTAVGCSSTCHPQLERSSTLIDATQWPNGLRLRTFLLLWILVFTLGWTSAADSTVAAQAADCFQISETTETLATALFLVGIATGALFAGPISETIGRNLVYFPTCAVFLCFLIGSGASPTFAVQLVSRFFSGLFSSATLSMYGGSLADFLSPEERKWAWPIFALSPVLGPVLSPLAGGWVAGQIPWRWTYWISLVLSAFAFTLAVLFLPETYSGTLQSWRSAQFRRIAKDTSKGTSTKDKPSLKSKIFAIWKAPFEFFATELIIQFLGAYLTLIYVIIFTFLNGFEFVFADTYGFSTGETGYAFLGVAIGNIFGSLSILLYYLIDYRRTSASTRLDRGPEYHLVPALIAAPFLAISLFVMGWTNYVSISPWVGLVSTAGFGYAMNAIFISSYQYIIESYGPSSSTALASITTARYYISAGMVVASRPMYIQLGVHWTLTFLGGLAVVLIPVPYVLYIWGESIRRKSKIVSSGSC